MNNLLWMISISSSLFLSTQANACSCLISNRADQIEWADTILVAEVSNVEHTQATLLPIEVIKGKVIQPLIFSIGYSNCDYFSLPENVHVGDRHLFYLRLQDGKLNASICSHSGPIEKKGVELEELRKQFK